MAICRVFSGVAVALAILWSMAPLAAQETSPTAKPEAKAPDGWWTHRGDLLGTGQSKSKTDATQGKVKWRFLTSDRLTQTPCVSDGVVYIGNLSGVFYAVDAKTGKKIWSDKLPEMPNKGAEYYRSNPVIAGDLVCVISRNGTVSAFRRKTGKLAWRRTVDGLEVFSSPRYHDGKLYFGSLAKKFYALDAKTGEDAWHVEVGDLIGSSAVVMKSGRVVFPTHDKFLYMVDGKTGRIRRKFELGYRSTGSPLMAFGCLYMCMSGQQFACIDLYDGTVRWKQRATVDHQHGVGLWKNQVMLHLSRYLMAYDATTGRELWRTQLGGTGSMSPCVGVELVYIADNKGSIYACNLTDGKVRWKCRVEDKNQSSPVLYDGLVYVGDGTGYLVAIE